MKLFAGKYKNKIDKKGRVSLPARFRSILENEGEPFVYLRRHPLNPALELLPYARILELHTIIETQPYGTKEYEDASALLFDDLVEIKIESDGRLMIPAEMAIYANLEEIIEFIGRGRSILLWHPEEHEKQLKNIREKRENGLALPRHLGSSSEKGER